MMTPGDSDKTKEPWWMQQPDYPAQPKMPPQEPLPRPQQQEHILRPDGQPPQREHVAPPGDTTAQPRRAKYEIGIRHIPEPPGLREPLPQENWLQDTGVQGAQFAPEYDPVVKPKSWIQQNWWQAAIVAIVAVFVFVLVTQFLLARQHPTGLVTVYAGPTTTATATTQPTEPVTPATDTPAPATDTPQPAPVVNAPQATATPKPPPATAIPPTAIPQYIVTITVLCASPE